MECNATMHIPVIFIVFTDDGWRDNDIDKEINKTFIKII